MKRKQILSGDEAVAHGAWKYGVAFASAYPGTPSTEILEALLDYPDLHARWCVNEKVAFDEALGASIGGVRALTAMKHVGLNVAADSLMTASYTGVGGGLVVVSCDDPGMHSSQNEQDNRNYAAFAKVPMLEPADSQECLDYVGRALEISERFDTPVLLRLTTRISHTRCVVETDDERCVPQPRPFIKQPEKYVMIPLYARPRHRKVEERLAALAEFTETTDLNRIEPGDAPFGLIASGVAYQYAKEAFPEAPIFKLGFSWPLPLRKLREFVETCGRVYVIEELDPFIEEHLLAAGFDVRGKALLSRCGEYTPRAIREAIERDLDKSAATEEAAGKGGTAAPPEASQAAIAPIAGLPPRPPVMCPGCPHRGVFYALSKLDVNVMGDIGCYTLGTLPPLRAMDSCVCMGASVGLGVGLAKVSERGKTAAVIGDSTFIHSGIPALVDMVWNRSASVLIILDNRTTAMTGRQPTAASAPTGSGEAGEGSPPLDLVRLCKATGVTDVQVIDPYQLDDVYAALRRALANEGPSVILTNRPCGLLSDAKRDDPRAVSRDLCQGCFQCADLACPALVVEGDQVRIVEELCRGCTLCMQVCCFSAISVCERKTNS
ncbi:MAG: indolepyruvate ferredoxin oxidoreductase subunit alpha [Candidatus Sumerlaeia bacterium]|nr:indolepyruvate ferredoxin oxidoreductase subunit alpha [Candidatus Sumerlaeia bacterium]